MNQSDNTKNADSAVDDSLAEEHPYELLHAAIKLKRRGMTVHEVGEGWVESFSSTWYIVKDADGICSAVAYDPETDTVRTSTFEWAGKVDFTRKLVEMLNYMDSIFWVIALEDGYLNKRWIAIEVLVPLIEKGLKELNMSEDATAWLKLRLR